MAQTDTELVRDALEATKGLTQEERAAKLGVSQSTISRWEGEEGAIRVRKKDVRKRLLQVALAGGGSDYVKGARAIIDEVRALLDSLEARLEGIKTEGRGKKLR